MPHSLDDVFSISQPECRPHSKLQLACIGGSSEVSVGSSGCGWGGDACVRVYAWVGCGQTCTGQTLRCEGSVIRGCRFCVFESE